MRYFSSKYCLLGVVAAAMLLSACSTDENLPPVDNGNASPPAEQRVGSLLAEYKATPANPHPNLSIHAQFLDVRGVPVHTALEALEVWTPDRELDLDACSMRSPVHTRPSGQVDSIRLHLLDVGPIEIDSPAGDIRLQARRLPDLLSAFSGVIYGNEQGAHTQPLNLQYVPGGQYRFTAPGSAQTGGFSVDLTAPQPVRLAEISGQKIGNHDTVNVARGSALRVAWRPEPFGSSASELYLDVSPGFGPDQPELQCRVEDDGTFSIPAALVNQLAAKGSHLDLAMRRVQSRKIAIDGLDSTLFVLAATDQVSIHLR